MMAKWPKNDKTYFKPPDFRRSRCGDLWRNYLIMKMKLVFAGSRSLRVWLLAGVLVAALVSGVRTSNFLQSYGISSVVYVGLGDAHLCAFARELSQPPGP